MAESALASARAKPRRRAAVSVAPVARDPAPARRPAPTPSEGVGERRRSGRSRRAAGRVGDRHGHRAGDQASRDRPRPAQTLLDRPLEQVADHRRRDERAHEQDEAALIEAGDRSSTSSRERDQRRSGRPGVDSGLEVPWPQVPDRARRTPSPGSQGTSSVWADEEIGSSSAGPCSAPSATASRRRRREVPEAATWLPEVGPPGRRPDLNQHAATSAGRPRLRRQRIDQVTRWRWRSAASIRYVFT